MMASLIVFGATCLQNGALGPKETTMSDELRAELLQQDRENFKILWSRIQTLAHVLGVIPQLEAEECARMKAEEAASESRFRCCRWPDFPPDDRKFVIAELHVLRRIHTGVADVFEAAIESLEGG
jgi:hypothetical protein